MRIAIALITLVGLNAAVTGCAEDTPNTIAGTIYGEAVDEVDVVASAAQVDENFRLVISGGDLRIIMDLDAETLPNAVAGYPYVIDGRTSLRSLAHEANANQAPFIDLVAVEGRCADCDTQLLGGALTMDVNEAARLAGTLTLRVDATSEELSVIFDVELPAFDPNLIAEESVLDPQLEEPETTETTESVSEPPPQVEPKPVTSGTLSATSDRFTITIKPEQGVDFVAGKVVHKANFKNSDMYATAGHPFLKLSPGGAKSTESNPCAWHGKRSSFDDIPTAAPTAAGTSLPNAKKYESFVVKNQVGGGYTRGWIIAGDWKSVTIEYELLN